MVLKLVRIEPNHYINGKSETCVVMKLDESEIRYPMMYVELSPEATGTK